MIINKKGIQREKKVRMEEKEVKLESGKQKSSRKKKERQREKEKSKELMLKESFRDNLKYGELKVCKIHLEIYLQLPVAS